MSSNLPNIGVNAIVQNFALYQTQINQIITVTNSASNSLKTAATATQSHDQATQGLLNTLNMVNPQIGAMSQQFNTVATAAGASEESIAALAVPIAAVAAGIAGFLMLAQRGAGFSDIQYGFEVLTQAAGQTADVMLTKLHDASQGTIDDMQLEQIANQALLGVNANLAKSFGQDLPQMMKIARDVALTTGQDQVSILNTIDEAVKRGQTRALTNIGIVINQKAAFEDYAKSMDISVKSMNQGEQEQAILNAVMKQGTDLTNALGDAQESNATRMVQAQTDITNTLDDLSKTLQPVYTAVLQVFGGILSGILNMIKSVVKDFYVGGSAIIGALAGGITWAENNLIYPAVISIANLIASFLSGLSPPPMGPLSTIDQGGANVMAAWVEGFTGVSLDPITQVAQQVNNVMGSVADMSLPQVKAALLSLDEAIQPFQTQLDLVKNQFDAMDNIAKPALDSIDKQISLLTVQMNLGSQAAAQQIQVLDKQKQSIQDYVDTQQIAVDNAQIQLAIAQAQQGPQREALMTQEQELKADQSLTTSAKAGGKGAKTPKAKKGGGGAAGAQDLPGLQLDSGAGNQVTDFASQIGDLAGSAYTDAFTGVAGNTGTAIAAANQTQLDAAGNKISAAFNNLGPKLQTALVQPFQDMLSNAGQELTKLFDPGTPWSIPAFINKIPGAFATLDAQLNTSLVVPIEAQIANAAWSLSPDNPQSIVGKVKDFVTVQIPSALSDLDSQIYKNLVVPFMNEAGNVIGGIDTFFNGEGPGTLHGIFDNVVNFFKGLPARVSSVLSGLVDALIKSIVDPLVNVMNGVIQSVEGFLNNTIIPALNALKGPASLFASILPGGGTLSVFINAVSFKAIAFGTIPMPAIPGAAGGGMFSAGMMRVGERGEELIGSASPLAVFPNSFVTALDRLSTAISRPTQAAQYNTNTYYTTNNMTFNNLPGTQQAIVEMMRLQAVRAH